MKTLFVWILLSALNLVEIQSQNLPDTETLTIKIPQPILELKGKLLYTSTYSGGIDRDDRNVKPLPLQKFTLYVVSFNSSDSIPKIEKSFTSNEKGEFSILLPPGKYGFVTAEEAKTALLKPQFLPKDTENTLSHVISTSTWHCNTTCPIELNQTSIENIVITNHLSSFCMDCP